MVLLLCATISTFVLILETVFTVRHLKQKNSSAGNNREIRIKRGSFSKFFLSDVNKFPIFHYNYKLVNQNNLQPDL